jgi:hypothetical protein
MKNMILHNGSFRDAELSCGATGLYEMNVEQPLNYELGEYLSYFNGTNRIELRVMQQNDHSILLYPADSEIFNIPGILSNRREVPRFIMKTTGEILLDGQWIPIQIYDITRIGIGFSCDLALEGKFQTRIKCKSKVISMELKMKHMKKEAGLIKYGASVNTISTNDLFDLRLFIISQMSEHQQGVLS